MTTFEELDSQTGRCSVCGATFVGGAREEQLREPPLQYDGETVDEPICEDCLERGSQ